jgi:hypothetical protein
MKLRFFCLKNRLRAFAKQLTLLVVSAVMFFGLMQPALQAAPASTATDPLESSAPENLEQMRAERRAFQSQASQAANSEEKADSVGEVLTKKLNLEEIAEENVLTEDANKSIDRNASRSR